MMNYEDVVEYLLNIPKFASKTTHDNLRGFLSKLQNPQEDVPAIHVAGTNGKGSTCAFLSSILQKAGYQVGMFTSPHLIRINERFQLQGEVISDDEFVEMFELVHTKVEQGIEEGLVHPNFFEYLFLMAVCWYRKKKEEHRVDFVIYETGLGGRLDATNVLSPCMTIITAIGLDHMQYLGDTIEKIAGEKAGILKPATPCVYLTMPEEAGRVIQKRGEELKIPMIPVEPSQIIMDKLGRDWIDFSYQSMYDRMCGQDRQSYRLKPTALYQLENATLAIEAAGYILGFGDEKAGMDHDIYHQSELTPDEHLHGNMVKEWEPVTHIEVGDGETVNGEAVLRREFSRGDVYRVICQGLEAMSWSGRMEEIEPDVFVDGAHNEPAITAFCTTVTRMYQDKKVILLFAVSSDKSYNKMIPELCHRLDLETVIVTAIQGVRTTPVETVAELFEKYTRQTVIRNEDLYKAYQSAKERMNASPGKSRVFCVGSLYLVGELLEIRKLDCQYIVR